MWRCIPWGAMFVVALVVLLFCSGCTLFAPAEVREGIQDGEEIITEGRKTLAELDALRKEALEKFRAGEVTKEWLLTKLDEWQPQIEAWGKRVADAEAKVAYLKEKYDVPWWQWLIWAGSTFLTGGTFAGLVSKYKWGRRVLAITSGVQTVRTMLDSDTEKRLLDTIKSAEIAAGTWEATRKFRHANGL